MGKQDNIQNGGGQRHYIGLCGVAYQVRFVKNQREVFYENEWITHSAFVDRMEKAERWDVLCELAKGACILKPDEVKRLLDEPRDSCPHCFDGLVVVEDKRWGLVYDTCKCQGVRRCACGREIKFSIEIERGKCAHCIVGFRAPKNVKGDS